MEAGSITVIGAIPRGSDPDSGAEITQLTSDPAIHEDIYGEVPYMDASSRWLMYITGVRPYPHYPGEIWRADLHSRWLTPVCENVPGIRGIAVGPDQRYFYCQRQHAEDECEIVRTEIATLEQETYRIENLPEVRSMASVAPDNATYIFATKLDRQLFGIVKCDLEAREWAIVHEGTDICNAHPQIEPGKGEDYLIQHNRGCEFDDEGRCLRLTGDIGATLYLIDSAGGNYRELPVGQPHTWRVQGHQCWIGDSGEILLTVSGPDSDEMEKKGNLLAIRPGDEQPRVVARDYIYCHPNASRDGRFFVSDDRSADAAIIVGSIVTGKKRVLCRSRSSFGRPQYTHPHPYFSPDCRQVIYNSDCTGIPQVYAAAVPEGLLEELEEE